MQNRKSKIKMCGIAGFITPYQNIRKTESTDLLEKMCRVITHRGPDEQGTTIQGNAALGMRRLSIIDVSGGQQPIFNADGSKCIVFNGEIYNYRELKTELEQRGHRFKTNSDTETILLAFEEFGVKCVEKLRGMFAFAIWDKKNETLFMARDRVGKKPLFYSITDDGTFIFGSELKCLLESPKVKRNISIEALNAYLTFGYVPEPLCIFEDVCKLPPASTLTFHKGELKIEQFWDWQYGIADKTVTAENCVEELREKLREAVKVRLISEVPLGAFLSGGVDSSAVVGLMSQILEQPVKTFSIGFNEDSYNELKYARITAEHFKTEHHEFIVTPDLVQVVDEITWNLDEPFADQSALPTYMVAKLAREFVTVVLSGDGGDELFAGYTRYLTAKQRNENTLAKMPKFLREAVLMNLSANLPPSVPGKNYLRNIALEPLERYIDSVSIFNIPARRELFTENLQAKLNGKFEKGEEIFRRYAEKAKTSDALETLLYLDAKTYLVGDILTKVDRMTMAASVEARVPLLDHKLIEFVAKLPANLKLNGEKTKYIFKQAVRGLVPDAILDRPKQGFGVPLEKWINEQLREKISDTLLSLTFLQRGWLESKYIKLILDEHFRGRRDHSWQIWALFMLELWHRKFVE